MDLPTQHPPALRRGDMIAVVAPAGPLEKRELFDRGIATVERLGFRARFEERLFNRHRYMAGADDARAEELMQAFEAPEVRGVIAMRGGYGCSRLIPLLDEKRLRRHCKIFMGYSDLTTLHLYFRRRFGWVSVHGPMIATPGLAEIEPPEEEHLLRLWMDPDYLPRFAAPELEVWHPGIAEGRLTGGCLSLLLASLGTAYEIQTEGKILFIEDLGEPPYRLDRMLTQLRTAGKLDGIAGLILGSFEECDPANGGYTAADVLRDILEGLQVPTVAGFPAGHGPINRAIPLGLHLRLDADRRCLEFLEPLVVPP
ncbi:MAG: LD-carboxypeptidase [Acidobacteriota bacterium]